MENGYLLDYFQYLDGSWQLDWTPSAPGVHTLQASASMQGLHPSFGQDLFAESGALSIAVALPDLPGITLYNPSPDGAIPSGQSVGLRTSLVGDIAGLLPATVEFFANQISLGTAPAEDPSLLWTPPATGDFEISATFTDRYGRSLSSDPLTVLVRIPPKASITSPAANASFAFGQDVSVDISVVPGDGAISSIELLLDGTRVDDPQDPAAAAFLLSGVSGGWHQLAARVIAANHLSVATPGVRFFKVRGVNPSLPVPSPLSAARSSSDITLSWPALPASNRVVVERWDSSLNMWSEIGLTAEAGLQFTDGTVSAEERVSYRVAALDSAGLRSGYSEEIQTATKVEPRCYAVIDLGESLRDSLLAMRLFDPRMLVAQLSGPVPMSALLDLGDSQPLDMSDSVDVLLRKRATNSGGTLSLDYFMVWHLDGRPTSYIGDPGFHAARIAHDGKVVGFVDYSSPKLTLEERDSLYEGVNLLYMKGLLLGDVPIAGGARVDLRAAVWTPGGGMVVELAEDPRRFVFGGPQGLVPPLEYTSLHIAWDGSADGSCYVGEGTFLDLAGINSQAELNELPSYYSNARRYGMRWHGADWDAVGALGLEEGRVDSVLMACNRVGTVSVGVSAVGGLTPENGLGHTYGIRTSAMFGLSPREGDPVLEKLLPLGAGVMAWARDVDEAGNAVGASTMSAESGLDGYEPQIHAVTWSWGGAQARMLPNLREESPVQETATSDAVAVSRSGRYVVGHDMARVDLEEGGVVAQRVAALWVRNQAAADAGLEPWEAMDLDAGVTEEWDLSSAHAVNDQGIILAQGRKWVNNAWSEPHAVVLLPVEFKKIYEENNPVNFVHDTTPKDDPPPLPRNILYTVIVPQSLDYQLKLEMEIPEAFRTKFMWAVVNNQNQTAGEGFFPADGPADVVFDHNASEWRGDYDVFVGYDANSNSVLDESERMPVTVPKLNQPLKIHGANSDAYAASNIAIATGGILGGYVVPLTEALLDIFFFGGTLQVEEGWKPTSTTTVSFNCFSDPWSDWLTHNAGAGFNASGDATIKLYTWDSSTQASDKLASAPAIKDNLLAMYGLKQSQIASALEGASVGTEMSFPSVTGWYEFPLNRITFEDQILHKDEYYAIARVRISGFKVRFKAKKTNSGVDIIETVTTGAIEDLYDFNYITPFPAVEAATVQISHGNGSFGSGREAGQIYRNRFEFYKTWNGLP